jgi:hypothetical protein
MRVHYRRTILHLRRLLIWRQTVQQLYKSLAHLMEIFQSKPSAAVDRR